MAPDAGRSGVASGALRCLGGGDAHRAAGLDDGFLKGRLGRTRFGENERYMAAAVNIIKVMSSQTVYFDKCTKSSFAREKRCVLS